MRIDGAPGVGPQGSGPTTYVANEGDTLQSVAELHRISSEALANANFLPVDSRLAAGQELIIPNLDFTPQAVPAVQSLDSEGLSNLQDSLEIGSRRNAISDLFENPEVIAAMKLSPADADSETIAAAQLSQDEINAEMIAAMKLSPADANAEIIAAMKLSPADANAEMIAAAKVSSVDANAERIAAMKLSPADANEAVAHKLYSPSFFLTYSVEEGDTLESVAQRFNLGAGDLAKANNLQVGQLLALGTELKIPQE